MFTRLSTSVVDQQPKVQDMEKKVIILKWAIVNLTKGEKAEKVKQDMEHEQKKKSI